MKYIDVDRAVGVTWDRYFEYLKSVQGQLPQLLQSYALDWGHYSLDGVNSLHDSWLIGVRLGRDESELMLEFIGARHDRRHVLRYIDVKAYRFDLQMEFPSGDRDVFVHEFRIEGPFVTHEVMFANEGRIVVTARTIAPEVGLQL